MPSNFLEDDVKNFISEHWESIKFNKGKGHDILGNSNMYWDESHAYDTSPKGDSRFSKESDQKEAGAAATGTWKTVMDRLWLRGHGE